MPASQAPVFNPQGTGIIPSSMSVYDPKTGESVPVGGAAKSLPNTITSPQQKAVEPTVLTSSNADQKVTDNQAELSRISNQGKPGYTVFGQPTGTGGADIQTARESGGTYQGQDNLLYYKFDQTPVTGQGSMIPGTTIPTTGDTGVDTVLKQFSDLKTQMDSTSAAQIANIQNSYESLIAKQQQINAGQEAGITKALIGGGSQRYSPISSGGAIATQMSYGLNQIADLQSKEQAAIISAQQAAESGDQKLLDSQLTIFNQIRQEKQAAAQKLNDQIATHNQALQTQQEQATKDAAISKAMDTVGLNAKDILNTLQSQGLTTITAKDVTDALGNLSTNANASLEKLSGDTKDFYLLQKGGLLPTGITDLGSYLHYINGAKQTPAQLATAQLGVQQKTLAIQRTGQLIESAKALEAARIVGQQITHDKGVQNYLQIAPMMSRLKASEEDIKQNGINQSNAADLLDAVTQINTGGKQITEGQISLTKDSQSYADQATALLQKLSGQGGVIDPKIANDAIRLSTGIFNLYQGDYLQRVKVYNQRLKNVAGQDLTAYSPLTDITSLPGVVDGSYESALNGSVQDTQQQVNTINAQSLLDNPPPDVAGTGSYDPSMWNQ